MRKERLIFFILLLCAAPLLFSCNPVPQKKLNNRVTLKRSDKIPYGTYVAYENLKYIFPSAEVEINKTSPSSYQSFVAMHDYSVYDSEQSKKQTLYIIVSPYFSPNGKEYDALMRFIGAGNHVFISAQYWSEGFQDSLKMSVSPAWDDSLWATIRNPVDYDSLAFTYPGYGLGGYFREYDTTYAHVLGHDTTGHVNYIKHSYKGGGSLYMHTSPLAFTNFFLLHKSNNAYYNNVLSYLPQEVTQIEWDDYFRYGRQFSALQVIMDNPSLRAAFWVTLGVFLLIFLFDSKRKQRIIPKIPPLKNASLDFVKTVGILYYQYRDNRNLAIKMTAHLMDYIRSRYNIPTSVMDERFVSALSNKSGYDADALRKLVYQAKMIQDSPRLSDQELMEFHKLTEAFYKHQ